MRPHLTVEQRQLALQLKARGLSLREIGPQVGCSHQGTDLSVHSADDLARIARSLNDRPRKTLGFMKPSEKLTELLAHTG